VRFAGGGSLSAEQAKQFLDQATQSLQGGQFEQALELAEQAIGLAPENSEAFVLKGIALSQLSRPDESTESFRHAIMLAPYNVKAYFNLAVHYYALGQKVPAEEMAREAVRIEPKHAGARDLLGRLELEKLAATQEQNQRPVSPHDPLAGPGAQPPFGHTPRETPGAPPPQAQPPAQPPVVSQPSEAGPGPQPPDPIPPPSQAPAPPPEARPAAPAPSAPPPGYYRPGYQQPATHSLTFVENLGKAWDSAGWGLAVFSTIVGIVSLVRFSVLMAQYNWDIFALNKAQQNVLGMSGGDILLNLIFMFLLLMSFVWLMMELTDRRGNWLWLLPFIICCCCYGYGPVMMIYLWKGRE